MLIAAFCFGHYQACSNGLVLPPYIISLLRVRVLIKKTPFYIHCQFRRPFGTFIELLLPPIAVVFVVFLR